MYNVKVLERPATIEDAFPHWAYWRELPALVIDGCAFSYEQAQKAYYAARHRAAPPLDPSLSRRLAEDEDAAGHAT